MPTRTTKLAAAAALRCAIYCRISEDPRDLGKGVKRQEKLCREVLDATPNAVLAGVYTDNDLSAFKANVERPDFQRLLADVRRGAIDRVIVYMTSRLVRTRRERAEVIDLFAERAVSIVPVKGMVIDLDSAAGRMVAGIMGEMDTAESEVKSERVASVALERAEEGRANGHVAYGWRRVRTFNGLGKLLDWHDEEDPDQAAVVREIVRRLLAKESIKAIVTDLNTREVPPPRAALRAVNGDSGNARPGAPAVWQPSTVRKVALRPANIAIRTRGRQEFSAAAWPAIVDPTEHAQVVAMLKDPVRATTKAGARRHLLTFGIGRCGVCGHHLSAKRYYTNRAKTKNPYFVYVCASAKACVGRSAAKVDDLVQRHIIERLSRPDARDLLTRDDTSATEARERAQALRAKLAQSQDDYDADLITREQHLRSTKRHRQELKVAEAEVACAVHEVTPELVARLACPEAEVVWKALGVAQKRALLETLGVTVSIYPQRQGPGFDPECVRVVVEAELEAELSA